MARLPRAVFPGHPHYVAQRGTSDHPVFKAPADYRVYLNWLKTCSDSYGVEVWAYCIMPKSVDLVCVPRDGGALSRTFNTVHMRYAQYIQGKRSVRGGLWEARFKSCVMDEPTPREGVRWIETIPVRAGCQRRRLCVVKRPSPCLRIAGSCPETSLRLGSLYSTLAMLPV